MLRGRWSSMLPARCMPSCQARMRPTAALAHTQRCLSASAWLLTTSSWAVSQLSRPTLPHSIHHVQRNKTATQAMQQEPAVYSVPSNLLSRSLLQTGYSPFFRQADTLCKCNKCAQNVVHADRADRTTITKLSACLHQTVVNQQSPPHEQKQQQHVMSVKASCAANVRRALTQAGLTAIMLGGLTSRMSGCSAARTPLRCIRVSGKPNERDNGQEKGVTEDENNSNTNKNNTNGNDDTSDKGKESDAQNKSEHTETDGAGRTKGTGGSKHGKPKMTFMQHIRGIRDDYASFPDIYSGANFVNFIIFTVFCLCSTGSNTEETWWMRHWTVDNSLMPHAWLLHSCLTNNFLSMAYAMMMLHSMCHLMLPTIGSRGLLGYTAATAVLSGAIIWLGNRLVYGANGKAHEKQFGPWDVLSAMFVLQYVHFGITPMTTLNSFNSWMRYACWTGQICIMYFDWQPTFAGALVGLALCRGVPRFRPKPLKNA